jgi:hypothetical protein
MSAENRSEGDLGQQLSSPSERSGVSGDASRHDDKGGGLRRLRPSVRPFSYKVREASVASGLSTGVLYAAIRENRLPAFQPHPRAEMLVFRRHLIDFISKCPVNELASEAIVLRRAGECAYPDDKSGEG